MATKTVKVHAGDGQTTTNLQIIVGKENGIPVFEPHKNQADRVKIANGTQLVVLNEEFGNVPASSLYYYIADVPKNGNFRRYFIKVNDVKNV